MVDRIVEVEPQGGAWGLGLIVSEKDLRPDDWYFPCHFKDDEVMAGSLVAEGCSQLLQFYLLYLGMQTKMDDARFQPLKNFGTGGYVHVNKLWLRRPSLSTVWKSVKLAFRRNPMPKPM